MLLAGKTDWTKDHNIKKNKSDTKKTNTMFSLICVTYVLHVWHTCLYIWHESRERAVK